MFLVLSFFLRFNQIFYFLHLFFPFSCFAGPWNLPFLKIYFCFHILASFVLVFLDVSFRLQKNSAVPVSPLPNIITLRRPPRTKEPKEKSLLGFGILSWAILGKKSVSGAPPQYCLFLFLAYYSLFSFYFFFCRRRLPLGKCFILFFLFCFSFLFSFFRFLPPFFFWL